MPRHCWIRAQTPSTLQTRRHRSHWNPEPTCFETSCCFLHFCYPKRLKQWTEHLPSAIHKYRGWLRLGICWSTGDFRKTHLWNHDSRDSSSSSSTWISLNFPCLRLPPPDLTTMLQARHILLDLGYLGPLHHHPVRLLWSFS